MAERESNYDKFKMQALKRFLTYEQEPLIQRLKLVANDEWIYVHFLDQDYRIHRSKPCMEFRLENSCEAWKEADANAVLTICDLLCHTEDPIVLSGYYKTVESLNRVKGGSSTILGGGIHERYGKLFDGKADKLRKACEQLHGEPMGKGDVAYRIPLFEDMSMLFSFYESDDEFPAKMTIMYDENICTYLFYETIWYLANLVVNRMTELIEAD